MRMPSATGWPGTVARSAPTPCAEPGCSELVSGGRCLKHSREALPPVRHSREGGDTPVKRYRGSKESRSGSRAPIYSSSRWRRLSKWILTSEPLCRMCRKAGEISPATVVDHIEEIRDRPDLQWETSNLQPLCRACHSHKTAKVAASRRREL